jgi:thiamine biosynthesis lipoprotein
MCPEALRTEVASRAFGALGGLCEIYAIGQSESALDAAVGWTLEMHHRFTRFEPESELSHFNSWPERWVTISADLDEILRVGLDAYERSGGLVHIGVLPALRAAGYTRTFNEGPTESSLEAARPLRPLPELLREEAGWWKLTLGAAIDLGGVAKGWLADRCVERLGDNALANFAGDLYARGPGPGGEGWPVGFGDRTLLLRDMGAATSGVVKRSWGAGLHHLIDPRTGLPSTTDLQEISVLATSATEAEILAKTALLMGRDAGIAWLEGKALGWATT